MNSRTFFDEGSFVSGFPHGFLGMSKEVIGIDAERKEQFGFPNVCH
jgi:hypothetical protein